MHSMKHTVGLICVLFCGLTACSPVAQVSLRNPDEVLFDRAMEAVQRESFTVAHLTLETLVNTYPDSKYAAKAKVALRDPRIANCSNSWTTASGCDGTPERMEPDR
jgi:outer membrane protein assembly factor BamD (BamD/ComL family)